MPSSELSTFLPVLAIVLAMILWWRAAIAVVGAFLIAVLIIGMHEVVDRFDQHPAQETVIGPSVGPDLLPVPGSSSRSGPRQAAAAAPERGAWDG
ncbi:MAG: hypothetical protein ACRDRV_16490 [Pseudonocardiaceae bacterium]